MCSQLDKACHQLRALGMRWSSGGMDTGSFYGLTGKNPCTASIQNWQDCSCAVLAKDSHHCCRLPKRDCRLCAQK